MNVRAKYVLRKVMEAVSPSLLAAIKRRRQGLLVDRHMVVQERVKQGLFGDEEPYVLGGPFAGMRHFHVRTWCMLGAQWVGCYEAALHPLLEAHALCRYTTLINLGCSDGYYAVGAALKCPRLRVFAFDIDPDAQVLTRRLASL